MSLRHVQMRLADLGFDPGEPDGLWGRQTEAAVNAALDRLGPAPRLIEAELVARQPFAVRTINEIVIHCSATPEGRHVSVATIRDWHKAFGWRDIGYHYVVLLDGRVEAGRPEAEIGAHCYGRNEGTLGVVYVGGVEENGFTPKDTRTPAQKDALAAIVRALCVKYPKITLIAGHREYAARACPSFDVRRDPLASIPKEISE